VIVAMLAVAALAGGGSVAFADHGPGGGGGSGGSGSSGEQGGHHEGGDDHGDRQQPGDDRGAKHEAGEDRHDNQGPGNDEDDDAQPADVYTLAEPEHGNPEGVAFDKRSGFFFVSATGDGAIYRGKLGDTVTPVPVFIPGAAGQSATGLKVQRGKLYAAGASTGTIKVYDVNSGALLATFDTKGGDSSPTFVNDLDVTKRGDVYATDSKRPAIYHLTAEEIAAGTPAPKPIDPDDVISTSPEIPFNAAPTAFNLNGIVVDNDRGDDEGHHGGKGGHHGRHRDRRRADELIVVDSDTGQLFRVKVGKDGNDARRIRELKVKDGPFKGGDGLLIDRGRLIVVQGSADGFPNGVVDFIELRHDGRKARLEDQRTDASFQGPSTIARARDRYLVVNPDFATSTPPFTVTALAR
jgi:Cu-Zn family superoxide dismutase